jgi:hypothetical protein
MVYGANQTATQKFLLYKVVTKIEDWDNSKFSWQPRANKAYIISLAPNSSNTGVVPTLAA